MNKKILGALFALIMASSVIATTFASAASNNVINDLDAIIARVNQMKSDYDQLMQNYNSVLDQIDPATKAAALELTDNLSDEAGITTVVNQVKTELQALGTSEATTLISEINNMKSEAKDIVDEGKDIIDDFKANSSNMSVNEIRDVVDKAKDTLQAFGGAPDKTAEYNQLRLDITDIRADLTALNNRIKIASATYEDEFVDIATETLARNVVNKVLDRDFVGALDLVKNALRALGIKGVGAANEIEAIKNDVIAIKNSASTVATNAEDDVLYFTDAQINSLKSEADDLLDEYTVFGKYMVNNFVKPNYQTVVNKFYDYDINTALDKADEAIDRLLTYETRIRNKINEIKQNPPKYLQAIALLGSYDENDVKNYIQNSFSAEIAEAKDTLVQEIDRYIQHVEDTMENEIQLIANSTSINVITKQTRILAKNTSYALIKSKIAALEAKININVNRTDVANRLNTIVNNVYDIYDLRMLNNIEQNFTLEDTLFRYVPLNRYIVASDFILPDGVQDLTGLTSANVSYNGLYNSKIKTTSAMLISISPTVFETYTFVVKADVNGDGKWNVSDVVLTIDSALRLNSLTDVKKTAADMNLNGSINISDVIQVIDTVLGI